MDFEEKEKAVVHIHCITIKDYIKVADLLYHKFRSIYVTIFCFLVLHVIM